jgi:hypothetical protein
MGCAILKTGHDKKTPPARGMGADGAGAEWGSGTLKIRSQLTRIAIRFLALPTRGYHPCKGAFWPNLRAFPSPSIDRPKHNACEDRNHQVVRLEAIRSISALRRPHLAHLVHGANPYCSILPYDQPTA